MVAWDSKHGTNRRGLRDLSDPRRVLRFVAAESPLRALHTF
jgi:hypothetical protein